MLRTCVDLFGMLDLKDGLRNVDSNLTHLPLTKLIRVLHMAIPRVF